MTYQDKDKKVEFGIENVHIFGMTQGPEGTWTCEKPEAVTGCQSLTLNPIGEKSEVYADNKLWYSEYGNQGYEGELEFTRLTTEFRQKWLGDVKLADGAVYEVANPVAKPFGLMFEVKNDKGCNRYILFNGTLSRPSEENKTNEVGKTYKVSKLNATFGPIQLAGGEMITKATIFPGDSRFATLFSTQFVLPENLTSLPA